MELNLEEQTLIALFRQLDASGRSELLRQAAHQRKSKEPATAGAESGGQCQLHREEERPESSEPIFTE